MGQYYRIVNLTKKQFINPWSFGDGAKLLEFGCSSTGTMTALAVLLADGNNRGGGDLHSDDPVIGSWSGDSIVIAGDYADHGKFLTPTMMKQFKRKAPGMLRRKYEKDFAENAYPSRPDMEERLGKQLESIERGEFNLYQYADYFFENVALNVMQSMCADQYVKRDLAAGLIWRDNKDIPKFLKSDVQEARKDLAQKECVCT